MSVPDEIDPRASARALLDAEQDPPARAVSAVKRSLTPLARAGDLEAQTLLGAIELEIERRPKAARGWFERAAEQGGAAAKRSLGHLYATGLGGREDHDRAAHLFREAADGGDGFAMYNLAVLNDRTGGAYATFEETLGLLRAAVDGGVMQGLSKLGDLLARVDRDEEAVDCYLRAAELGDTGAMFALGCWARDGTAGAPDTVQAVRWYLRMVDAGDTGGMRHAVEVARGMSRDDIQAAALLAGRHDLGQAVLMSTSARRQPFTEPR